MSDQQYRRHKNELKRQRDAGIAVLEKAYEVQLRALEIVKQAGLGVDWEQEMPAVPEPKRRPPRSRKGDKKYGKLGADLKRALAAIDDGTFTLEDVVEHLPKSANRNSVRGALSRMARAKNPKIRILREGSPKKPALYAKPASVVPEPTARTVMTEPSQEYKEFEEIVGT